jgi:hypothetical protein
MKTISRSNVRVLKSDLYRRMVRKGWFHYTPYGVADLLLAIGGQGKPEESGLDVVPGVDGERAVYTIPLLLAMGYGTRRKAFYEWLDRHWPERKPRP